MPSVPAPRDQNYVPTALATDSTDPEVVLPVEVDPVTGYLLAEIA